MAARKQWEASEEELVARLAVSVERGAMTLHAASMRLAARVGGTPAERTINIRAGLNAARGTPDRKPRASPDPEEDGRGGAPEA